MKSRLKLVFIVALALFATAVYGKSLHVRGSLNANEYVQFCNGLGFDIVLQKAHSWYFEIDPAQPLYDTGILLKNEQCTENLDAHLYMDTSSGMDINIYQSGNAKPIGVWKFGISTYSGCTCYVDRNGDRICGDDYCGHFFMINGAFRSDKADSPQYVKARIPSIGKSCDTFEPGTFADSRELDPDYFTLPVCRNGKWEKTDAILNTQYVKLYFVGSECYGKGC
eukprot:Nk52_evm14s256 gene=Nk52_evmTU14s256